MVAQLHRPYMFLDLFLGDRRVPLFRITGGGPVNGTSGSFAGVAPVGALLETDEPALYQNTGTVNSPTWTAITATGGNASFARLNLSVAPALVASTTHSIAGGTPCTAQINKFATVANSGDAGTLVLTSPGDFQDVYNDGANPMAVYPPNSSTAIDGGSAGASVTLTNAKRCRYTLMAANTIESAQLGVPSA